MDQPSFPAHHLSSALAQLGVAKLEFALVTLIIGILVGLALQRLTELNADGHRALSAFQASEERASDTLQQAACSVAASSGPPIAACRPVKRTSGVQP